MVFVQKKITVFNIVSEHSLQKEIVSNIYGSKTYKTTIYNCITNGTKSSF